MVAGVYNSLNRESIQAVAVALEFVQTTGLPAWHACTGPLNNRDIPNGLSFAIVN